MMKQYFEIKDKNKDYILMYRLGDFYEMFFEDAELVSRELELTLTGRDCGLPERAPMCGVPYHSAESYIGRLVHKGYKVAICEQVEDPKSKKGLLKRQIVRRVTPGAVVDGAMLDENRNNFLGCVYSDKSGIGLCFTDISTGEIYATCVKEWKDAVSEIARFSPKEVLIGGLAVTNVQLLKFLKERLQALVEPMPNENFNNKKAAERLEEYLSITDFEAAGLTGLTQTIECLGGLLYYLEQTQKPILKGMNRLRVYREGQFMDLDFNTRRNLELCETIRTKECKGSLLWVLNQTQTSMGARLIRQWIEQPLCSPLSIRQRQEAIEGLCNDVILRSNLIESLKKLYDMERIITRVVYGTSNARGLRLLAATLSYLPEILENMKTLKKSLIVRLANNVDVMEDIRELIDSAIVEEPPVSLHDGGIIRKGYDKNVDELRDLATGGKEKIAGIELRERENTGIKNLKIGYNRVFGYYIEVGKAYADKVPSHYVRKQTLANGERYITDELKQLESTVLSAHERLTALEYETYNVVREKVAAAVHRVQSTAKAIAELDVLCALATVACENNYVCPEVDFSGTIEIKDGRHPVVEKLLSDSMFIPNDTILDNADNRVAIITGPNMAGKSTYMRQIALIVIMAQMGSYVPASSAHIGVADRVFTRVGASDDLSGGQSTFMIEMSEVADILKKASKSSLVILDEIGRGTSTYDGMSIARAVVEYIANPQKVGSRTLFATHYHELTALEDLVDGVKNYNIAAKKRGDDITFLRKIVRGGADESYGIEVAKLAGVPNAVIKRAKAVLADLEKSMPHADVREVKGSAEPQISIETLSGNAIVEKLRDIHIDTLTPIEALNTLYELKKML